MRGLKAFLALLARSGPREPPAPQVRWAQRARQVQRERKARQEFKALLARPDLRGPLVWLGPQEPLDLRVRLALPDRQVPLALPAHPAASSATLRPPAPAE